jgi:hypothetical protein
MRKRINNLWELITEVTEILLIYLNDHRWQARVLFFALAVSCITCSITAMIITTIFLINKFL